MELHLDVADGSTPVSRFLTSASTHDSQAAIPLTLMDFAYDVIQICECSQQLDHVSLNEINLRRNPALQEKMATENKIVAG